MQGDGKMVGLTGARMSAAAKPQLSQPQLWIVLSIDRGFHTARGWHRSADFALLFTKPEVDQFISEQADDVLPPILYDPRVAHNDTIRVIGHKTKSAQDHDLNKVALAALTELESHHGASDLRVEVVRHEVAEVPEPEYLTDLV